MHRVLHTNLEPLEITCMHYRQAHGDALLRTLHDRIMALALVQTPGILHDTQEKELSSLSTRPLILHPSTCLTKYASTGSGRHCADSAVVAACASMGNQSGAADSVMVAACASMEKRNFDVYHVVVLRYAST